MKAFVEFVEFAFTKLDGVSFFLSEKLSQDPLESFFGIQRMRGRSNEKEFDLRFGMCIVCGNNRKKVPELSYHLS